jgi:cysteine desulfurase
MDRIYLDYAATTPIHPDVVQAMLPYFTEVFGNPSGIYYCGQEAKNAIEEARAKVAESIKASVEEIIFTGGGTEADNFALQGVAFANERKGNHIITSAIEHHAIIETAKFLQKRGFQVTFLPVDSQGLVSPDNVRRALTNKTILISIMHANNEIGTIQPVDEIARIAREANVYFHTDAVQSVGHLPTNVKEMDVDLLSMSAHKFYGPKGVGALYIKKGTRIGPFIHGGGQERGKRASTENTPGIIGLSRALEISRQDMIYEAERLAGLRDMFIAGLFERIDHIVLNGHPARRLPNNVNISIDFVEGESMCLNLDLAGICASSGSACSSSSLEASHVLLALGLSHERAHGSLRFSLGKGTTVDELDRVLEVLPEIISKLRAMSPLYRK